METIKLCEISASSVQRLGLEAVISGDIQQFQHALRMTPSGENCTLPEILSLTNTFWNMQKTSLLSLDQENRKTYKE